MQAITYTTKSIILDPVSRIEGHLKVEVVLDAVNGRQVVVDALSGVAQQLMRSLIGAGLSARQD